MIHITRDSIEDKKIKNIALFVVSLGSFLIPLMGSSLNIALPIIQKDLTINIILLSWIPTVFVLANASIILPLGRLGDVYGRKKIYVYGIIIYTVASLFAALSNSGIELIISSFIQGVGCAMIFATGLAILSSVYPSNQLGKALGLYVTAVYLGLFLGPLLGGFLVENFGWRSIYIFNIPFGIFLFIFIKTKFHGEWKGLEGKFKIVNSIIYSLSIVILLYGFSTLNTNIGKLSLLLGVIGLLIFIIYEKRSINPILSLSILRKKASSLSALAILLINIANTAMWVLLSLYLEDIMHLNPQFTALIISVQPLTVALLSIPVGRLSNRIENRIFAVMGMIITTLGLLILSQLTSNSRLLIPIIGLILMGIGLGLFSSPTISRFMTSVEEKNYGMANGLLSTMTYMGQTMSLGIMLYIFTIYLGNVQITESNFQIFLLSLKTAFIIFAILSGFGIIISIVIGSTKK